MTLYLDMDGVLADFDKAATEVLGYDSYRFEWRFGTDEFWKRLNAEPEFWINFDPMPDFDYLWRNTKGLNPVVLTALPKKDAEGVREQKLAWIKKHLGDNLVITCLTSEKANYCHPGDILIDDRNVNERRWIDAGGHFIHHQNAFQSVERLNAIMTYPKWEEMYA